MEQQTTITSRDYWFKVVGMLLQNWALIECVSAGDCRIYFISDTSGVLDELEFPNALAVEAALRRNGFARFQEDEEAQNFLSTPVPPYFRRRRPNGPIYSSGRHWR